MSEYDLDYSRESAALHEAGHAVVAEILGYDVTSISIFPSPKAGPGHWDGFTDFSGPKDHAYLAVIRMAGTAVQMRAAGQPMHLVRATYCGTYGGGGSRDWAAARKHCRNAGPGHGLRWAWKLAAELTADADAEIEDLARKVLAGTVEADGALRLRSWT